MKIKKDEQKKQIKNEFSFLIQNNTIRSIYSRVLYYNFFSFLGIIFLVVGLILLFGIPDNLLTQNIYPAGQFLTFFGLSMFVFFKFLVFVYGKRALDICEHDQTTYFQKYFQWWMFFYFVGEIYLIKARKIQM